MSEDKKDPTITNVIEMDDVLLKRMRNNGHYISQLERFDVLRIKFLYDTLMPDEAREFMLLIKYLMVNGHSEAVRLNCFYLHKKYIESQKL